MRNTAIVLSGFLATFGLNAQAPSGPATFDKGSKVGASPGNAASATAPGLSWQFVPVDPKLFEGAKGPKSTVPKDGLYLIVPTAIPGHSILGMDYNVEPDLTRLMQAQTRAIKDLSDRLKVLEDRLKVLEKGKP